MPFMLVGRGDTHDLPVVQSPQFFRACCVSSTLECGVVHHSKIGQPMAGPGHLRQLGRPATLGMSALPRRRTNGSTVRYVSFVPLATERSAVKSVLMVATTEPG
jgi:hypothetical protein